jgi:hypothetical protein
VPASLAGVFAVEESAGLLRHYRYAAERMMRILGGWIALTPELSAKLLLGRQVWESAQLTDALGRRLLELRTAAQVSEPSGADFVAFMDELERPEAPHQTVERLIGIYRVLKPHLLGAYEWHLTQANPVYEPPTRRILSHAAEVERRHISAGETILRHLIASPALEERAGIWQGHLQRYLVTAGGVTGRGLPPASAYTSQADPEAAEFVRLEQSSRPRSVPDALLAALRDLGDALVRGDQDGADRHFSAEAARPEVLATGHGPGRLATHGVVALARVGRQYLAKLRLEGPGTGAVILTRWRHEQDGWRIVAAEVLGVEAPARA